MRTLSAADSSTKVVKGFVDVMAKESFKMVLEGYQNKSEDIYTVYSASMREATEEKMRRACFGMATLDKRRWYVFRVLTE